MFPDICHVGQCKKRYATMFFSFFSKILPIYSNFCVFNQPLRCIRKRSNNFHSKCQKTCCTLTNCLLRFGTFDNAKKVKIFCHREDSLFLKCLFLTISYDVKKKLISCTISVKRPSGPLQFVPWHSSCAIIREKMGLIFCSMERLPLFKKLCFRKFPGPK